MDAWARLGPNGTSRGVSWGGLNSGLDLIPSAPWMENGWSVLGRNAVGGDERDLTAHILCLA